MIVQRSPAYKIDKDAKLVDIELIKPVQTKLSQNRLQNVQKWIKKESQIQINVIKIDQFYYISNGHHRAYSALELSIKKMYVKEVKSKGKWIQRKEDWCDHLSKMRVVTEKEFRDYMQNK